MKTQTALDWNSGATFSDCDQYRYELWRKWGSGSWAYWILLNPSTADALRDDPTIRRCIRFSQRWGYGGMRVVNLFAWRATNPKELRTVADPVGPQNDMMIRAGLIWNAELHGPGPIVAGWGRHSMARTRGEAVLKLLEKKTVSVLGRNADGSPKHPLYVSYATSLTDL